MPDPKSPITFASSRAIRLVTMALVAATRIGFMKKSKPDNVSFGIPALGSTVHMASGLFEHDTGTKMLTVPYKEQMQMLTAIANGSVTWTMATSGVIAPMEQAGRLKTLAVAAKTRLPSRPDVPTMEEAAGLKDLDRKSTRLNSSHLKLSRMPSSA